MTARIPEPRSGSRDSVPAWPTGLIQPSSEELIRWADLWRHPKAAEWAKARFERMIADLVRLEVLCRQPNAADDHRAELDQLRRVLGLTVSP